MVPKRDVMAVPVRSIRSFYPISGVYLDGTPAFRGYIHQQFMVPDSVCGAVNRAIVVDFSTFIQGIIIGLTVAVPVGPNSVICIHKSITDGRLCGIVSGLGVATAHLLYAGIAVLGITAISGIIITWHELFQVIAGLALVVVGIRIISSTPSKFAGNRKRTSYPKDYFSLFAIAIVNPLTVIFFITILPGLWIVAPGTTSETATFFVIGVFSGSAVWWILLCGSLGSFRSCFNTAHIWWINYVSGFFIICFGAGILVLQVVIADISLW
jgi:threonine/homoserine/homoserine lactone efflux protein